MPRKRTTTPEEKKARSDRLKQNVEMYEKIKEKAQKTPIEKIEKKFPEELFRAMYESFLIMQRGLETNRKKVEKLQTADFFLGFLRDKKSLEAIKTLKDMGLKRKKEGEKRSKVKWSGKKKK